MPIFRQYKGISYNPKARHAHCQRRIGDQFLINKRKKVYTGFGCPEALFLLNVNAFDEAEGKNMSSWIISGLICNSFKIETVPVEDGWKLSDNSRPYKQELKIIHVVLRWLFHVLTLVYSLYLSHWDWDLKKKKKNLHKCWIGRLLTQKCGWKLSSTLLGEEFDPPWSTSPSQFQRSYNLFSLHLAKCKPSLVIDLVIFKIFFAFPPCSC